VKNEPRWLLYETVLAIHAHQLAEHGGREGIRDSALLDSALQRPINKHLYAKSDVFDLAAAYAYGIARNHPFVDGNKRTAFVAAQTFLLINGFRLAASQKQRYEAFMAVAAGQLEEDKLATWYRENAAKR
jgi:death-on-curing protein